MGRYSRHLLALLFCQCQYFQTALLALLCGGALIAPPALDSHAASANKAADAPLTRALPVQGLSLLTAVAREVSSGQTQSFSITLNEGHRLRATLSKADLDLQVT